jgi:hypothetical protein
MHNHWWLEEPEYIPLITANVLHRQCGHITEEAIEEYNSQAVPGKKNTYYSNHWCSFCLEKGKHLESRK